MAPLLSSLAAISALFLVRLFQVRSAPLTRTFQRELEGYSTNSAPTVNGGNTSRVDEEDEDRAPIIPAQADQVGEGEQASSTALGPWAIAGIVVAVIATLAVAVVVGVAANRQRNQSANGTEVDDPQRHQRRRSIKFVPPNDDSWRGPPAFEEQIELPDPEQEDSEDSVDAGDERTVLEPLAKKSPDA